LEENLGVRIERQKEAPESKEEAPESKEEAP